MREQHSQAGSQVPGRLPTLCQVVRQVCVLGQLLQLPDQVGGLAHSLSLSNLEDRVPFPEFLDVVPVCVPLLVQEEGRAEGAARGAL